MSTTMFIENRDHFESIVKEMQTKRAHDQSGIRASLGEDNFKRSPESKKKHWLLEEEINTKRQSYLV